MCGSERSLYIRSLVIGHIVSIIEREVKKQAVVYLQSNEIITIDESAYLEYHNTQTALHKVIDNWFYNMADRLFTAICSFDIKKCFDTRYRSLFFYKENGIL